MKTYIALLRGINVSGQKKILMTDLKKLFEELGYSDIVTYIQSGNVIFKTKASKTDIKLAAEIEKAIAGKYGFDVPVIVRSHEELQKVVIQNPYAKDKNVDLEKVYVTYLLEEPSTEKLREIKLPVGIKDEFKAIGKEVFLYCPGGYGETKLSNNFFESKLKVKATTRNWKTTLKLLELASNA
jgi:uncharacterized protein (DUF1697 family)